MRSIRVITAKSCALLALLIFLLLRSAALAVSGDENWANGFGPPPSSNGVDSTIYALAISGTNVYAGGAFARAGTVGVTNIARWNGSTWSALSSGGSNGVDGTVSAIAISTNGDVYVGGSFSRAGSILATNIARWNGSNWFSLGIGAANGVNDSVNAIGIDGTNVYVGGYFSNAGGVSANSIARWNGVGWSALGSGVAGGFGSGYVQAIAVTGTTVYIGGNFTSAGGGAATNIARWNGSSWSALGGGVGTDFDAVNAVAINGTNLYVGGNFATAGSGAATNIARWNGSAWSALGSGVGAFGDYVQAIDVSGTNVYVGGSFANAGSIVVNSIAQWNGGAWSALGSGLAGDVFSPTVDALATAGSAVYVGGVFASAGGKPSANFALWTEPPGVVEQILAIAREVNNVRVTWSTVGGRTYFLQSSPGTVNASYSTNFTDLSAGIGGTGAITNHLDVGGATNKPARYYRVRIVP